MSEQIPTVTDMQAAQRGGFARSNDFHNYFANQARVRVAPGEFTFTFSYMDETPVGPLFTEIAGITLTPTTARRLWAILTEMLKGYETKFGKIGPEPTVGLDMAEINRGVEELLKSVESN